MITTAQEYFANLNLIQNVNAPAHALLPAAERTYNIDINTRTIETPKFLGIEKDHKSETIYFKVDRYVDYMDLAQTCCVIQFNNAHNETRYYPVPFYDIYKFAGEKKIIFPWCLDAHVTDFPGPIQFSIRFFKVGEVLNENNEAVPVLTYNLNTLPAKSTVLEGIKEYKFEEDEYFLKPGEADRIWSHIEAMEQSNQVYWTILDDSFTPIVDSSEIQEELSQIIESSNKS